VTVRLLEDSLVDQIAAGEVVERPASVVKELVENSLDAHATHIAVTLRDGGRALIRVVDDGLGMDRHDAVMCLERHATSKIRNLHDLVHVSSLGFRGEAIPSIASVSRFQLLTRREDQEIGTKVRVEGGTLQGVSDAGCAVGTEIDVRNLFFNLPVRRQFLRTIPTELGHCVEMVVREALRRPAVGFEVKHEGRALLRAAAGQDHETRARTLLGDAGRGLRHVEISDRGVTMRGLMSPVTLHRGSASGVYLYVNGRYVRDPVLRRGVREAYLGIVPRGRHPVVVLELTLPADQVDVNAHPAKTEVRFRNPRAITELVAKGLREALSRHGAVRQVSDDRFGSRRSEINPAAVPLPFGGEGTSSTAPAPTPVASLPAHPADDPRFAAGLPKSTVAPWEPEQPLRPPTATPEPGPTPKSAVGDAGLPSYIAEPPTAHPSSPLGAAATTQKTSPSFSPPELFVLAVLDGHHAVCRERDRLAIVNLDALRREVLFGQLRDVTQSKRLLVPKVVEPGQTLAARLVAWSEALDVLGVGLEDFGPGAIALKRVPPALADAEWSTLLPEIARRLPAVGGPVVPIHVVEIVASGLQVPPLDMEQAGELIRSHRPTGSLVFWTASQMMKGPR
jgi:DNA mismatch repair protein MutL